MLRWWAILKLRIIPQYTVVCRHENPDLTISEAPARAYAEGWGAEQVFNGYNYISVFVSWDDAWAYARRRNKLVRSDENRYFVVKRAY